MSRADLMVSLVKAGSQGDQKLLCATVEAMAAKETRQASHHHQLADKPIFIVLYYLGKRGFNPFVVSLSNHDRIKSITINWYCQPFDRLRANG